FWLAGLLKRPIRAEWKWRWLISTLFLSLIVAFAVLYDIQIHKESAENIQSKFSNLQPQGENSDSENFLNKFLNNGANLSEDLRFEATYLYNVKGLEIIRMNQTEHTAVAFLAVVNLKQYEVVLDSVCSFKKLTSEFAMKYNVDIAVNGEAGMSPGPKSPLGEWTGMYAVNGRILINEDSEHRPFVGFNNSNEISYYPEEEILNTLPGGIVNVIWGRFDLMRNGELNISRYDDTQTSRYPRTVIGMDEIGERVFLLVVDGRNPSYSRGLTMEQCGKYLQLAGCWNAMACDQGGSSAMYLKNAGIINQPADGVERVVYTHLGFRKK
ncbi:MAG: phosphodiester glycosidase family protein, partial [Bacteroidota bacterium]